MTTMAYLWSALFLLFFASFSAEATDVPTMIDHTLIDTTILSLVSTRVEFIQPSDNNSSITEYQYLLCQDTCKNADSYSTIPLGDVAIVFTGFGTSVNQRLSFEIDGLVPGFRYILRIAAVNEVGSGCVPINDSEAHQFDAVSLAEAAAIDGSLDQQLQTQLVFSWELPSLASGPGIVPNIFEVTWNRAGSPESIVERIPYIAGLPRQGILLSNLTSNVQYIISVVTNYTDPNIESTAVEIIGATLLEGQEPDPAVVDPPIAVINNQNTLVIQWPVPDVNFLDMYVVSYTIESTFTAGRRKRQSPEITERVPANINTFTFDSPEPAARYTFRVDGEVLPPGATTPAVIPITPEQVIISSDQRPNEPTITSVTESANGDPFRSLDITWELPSMPGGMLLRCTIEIDSRIIVLPSIGSVAPTSHTVRDLRPAATHPFSLACSNRFDGLPASGSGRTAIGVERPSLALAPTNNVENNSITVQLVTRNTFGPIDSFQVIISTSPIEFSFNTSYQAYPGERGAYVTYTATPGQRASYTTSVVIGNGVITTVDGQSFTNQALEPGDYYVFVRAFGQVANLFNDSVSLGPINIPSTMNDENGSKAFSGTLFKNLVLAVVFLTTLVLLT